MLAEYVIALLKHDGDKAAVRKLCEQEIPDFLSEGNVETLVARPTSRFAPPVALLTSHWADPKAFLDDVFQAIAYRSFVPGAPPAPKLGAERQPLPPIHPQQAAAPAAFDSAGALNASRKRGFHEQDEMDTTSDGLDTTQQLGRAYKQPRRGGRGGRRDDKGGGGGRHPDGFVPPHNFSPFDPNNPMEALLQLQAMYPQNAHMMSWAQPRGGGRKPLKRQGRCRDFDTKGYCVRGTSCPYDHGGSESLFVPPPNMGPPGEGEFLPGMLPGRGGFSSGGDMEYDPNTAMLGIPHANQMNPYGFPALDMGRSGRGRKNRGKRGGPRASFSAEGPIHDRAKSTIVVESIPEENFSEEEVRGFFSQFGSIEEVSMQPYKRLAIVKYSKWGSANAAYSSPKVIFDNRFVKVFWYKDEAGAVPPSVNNGGEWSGDPSASVDEDTSEGVVVDMEDFARRQEEAQKRQEEREAKRAEIDQKRLELEQKQRDLLARHREENEKLQAKLLRGRRGGDGGDAPASGPDMLRAKLAALEQEAKLLGLDPDAEDDAQSAYSQPRGVGYRGRGGPRGRGGFAPRGRGGGRGGSGSGNMHAAYAQYSLDNRPKKLAVTGVDFTAPDKDESLRHFLLVRHLTIYSPMDMFKLTVIQNLGEFESVEPSATVTHVSFQDRKTAEKFYHMLHGNQLPGVEGRLELAWLPTSTAASTPGSLAKKTTTTTKPASTNNGAASTSAAAVGDDKEDAMTSLQADEDKGEAEEGEVERVAVNMDYEVADEDAW